MTNDYRKNARTAAVVFIISVLLAIIFWFVRAPLWFRIASSVSYIDAFFWYFYFAKAKGYSGWWALLGFLHLIGFIIILLMPNRNKTA